MIQTTDIDVAAFAKTVLKRDYRMLPNSSNRIFFEIDMNDEELEDYYNNSPFRIFKEEIDKIKKLITQKKRDTGDFNYIR